MKKLILIAAFYQLLFNVAIAQKIIPLYNTTAPGSEGWNWEQKESAAQGILYNVSQPSLEIYEPPAGTSSGTAVIIAPGGGFYFLSINNEGRAVAKWLTAKGITCFVLRYRLARSASDDPGSELGKLLGTKEFQQTTEKIIPLAVADGKAAIAWVRNHAKEYQLNPQRIGIMGFSAGGTVAAASLFNFTAENKPNFVAPVYPFFPAEMIGNANAGAPPLFIAVASDDNLNLAPHSIALYNKWLAAKLPVELHAYAKGGHGFGMRRQNLPGDGWIERFADWLSMQGLLTKKTEDPAFKNYQVKEYVYAADKVLPYRILYPINYDRNKKYPLVVFLHGSGERGNDNEKQLEHGGKLFSRNDVMNNYPAIVVFPQCPENISWNSMSVDRTKNSPVRGIDYSNPEPWPLAATYNLINSLITTENIDKKRVYLSGLSMGGFGTFEMIYRHPQLFAAALPICGGGDEKSYDKRVKNIPFWIFHGDADQAVDVKLSRQMVEKLKQIGATVKYTEYPGVGHNSWDNVFAEPDYLKWMFLQKK